MLSPRFAVSLNIVIGGKRVWLSRQDTDGQGIVFNIAKCGAELPDCTKIKSKLN